MTTTLNHLPSEVIQSILLLLPLEPQALITVALASKHLFASTLLLDLFFARRHFLSILNAHCPSLKYPSIWEFLDARKIKNQGFLAFPFIYKAAIYNEITHSKKWEHADSFDQSEHQHHPTPPSKELDFFDNERWNVDPRTALRIMKTLFNTIPRSSINIFNPRIHNSRPFRWACRLGHVEVVEWFLEKELVDPSDDGNHAIECAVDASTHENLCIILAAQEGHVGVVERLLSLRNVDPGADDSAALLMAVRNKRMGVIPLLLRDPSVNPWVNDGEPLEIAVTTGQVEVVNMLLADPRVMMEEPDHHFAMIALELENADVVEALLNGGCVDPLRDGCQIIQEAFNRGQFGLYSPASAFLVALSLTGLLAFHTGSSLDSPPVSGEPVCVQPPPLVPPTNPTLDALFRSQFSISNESYASAIAHRLSGLVQIDSQSFDDMKSIPKDPHQGNDDPRRQGILKIHEYLKKTWPQVHSTLSLEVVNYYGLVYTWYGNNAGLKPVMLTAHMDTVPVDASSLGRWTFPPFEGRVSDGFVWGRGSADVKAQIVSMYSIILWNLLEGLIQGFRFDAVETLLSNNYNPNRTIIIAFGFDEEISGRQGAGEITRHLLAKGFGNHGIEFILDEGSSIESQFGASFALLSTGERGYMDVEYAVHTPGGHSSIPPPHTRQSDIWRKLCQALEDNPYLPRISYKDLGASPLFNELQCGVEHGPDMDTALRNAIVNAGLSNKNRKTQQKLVDLLIPNIKRKALMMTSQAIDIINGGMKVNALPEVATAIGNYRIHPDESVTATESRIQKIVAPLAKKYNLTFSQTTHDGNAVIVGSDGKVTTSLNVVPPSSGLVSVTTLPDSLEPAPITPTSGKPFQLVAGTIRHSMPRGDENLYVSPSLPTGNSDTRYFHELSKHIFRFTPLRDHDSHNIHTVDEKCRVIDLVQSAGFFYTLLRNRAWDVLPPEIIQEILTLAPLDPVTILNIALAAEPLARLLLLSTTVPRRHFKKQWSCCSSDSIWEFLDSTGVTFNSWKSFPLSYQTAIYGEILASDEWPQVHTIPLELDMGNNLMWFRRWPLTQPLKTVATLAYHSPYFNITVQKNRLFRWSCRAGYLEAVKLLIKDPRVNPADDNQYAIRCSAEAGEMEVVLLLLQDPRIDPSGKGNYAIRAASTFGKDEIVKVLLADPRVDPSDEGNAAVILAARNGHTDVVRLLMQDARVDLAANFNEAIRDSSTKGRVEVVRLLLTSPLVDPSDMANSALASALRHGHDDIVYLLLEDDRVLPTGHLGRRIFQIIVSKNRADILKSLLKKVNVSGDCVTFMNRFLAEGLYELARILLDTIDTFYRNSVSDEVFHYFSTQIEEGIIGMKASASGHTTGGRSGEETGNVLSKLVLEWMTSFMVLASKRPLMAEDLFDMEPEFAAQRLGEKMFSRIEEAKAEWAVNNPGVQLNGNTIPEGLPVALRGITLVTLFNIFKSHLISGALWGLVGTSFSIASPMILQQVLVSVAVGDKAKAFWFCGLMFICQILATLCVNSRTKVETKVSVGMRTILYSTVFRKALLLSSVSKQEYSTGKIMNMLSIDAGKIEMVGYGFHSFWLVPLQVTVMCALIIYLLGIGGLVGILVLIVISASQTYAMKAIFKYDDLATRASDLRVRATTEMLTGMKIVKLFSWEDTFISKIQHHRDEELRNIFIEVSVAAAFYGMIYVIPAIVCIVAFSVYSALGHPLTADIIFPALSLISLLRGPMMELPEKAQSLIEANVALKRFARFMSCPELEDSSSGALGSASPQDFAIVAKDASFMWDDWRGTTDEDGKESEKPKEAPFLKADSEQTLIDLPCEEKAAFLQNITFEIPKGALVAVVGAVGAGKSSLVQALLGEMKNVSGATSMNGKVAYASQQGWLQNSTLQANDILNFPNGELTEVGERGVQLSGGQVARVNLARTMYADADILFLDDPLAAVDSHVGRHIFEIGIKENCAGKTVVLVTHQLNLLSQVDMIIYMEHGRILEVGSYSDLMQRNGGLSKLVNEYGIAHSNDDTDEIQPTAVLKSVRKKPEVILEDELENSTTYVNLSGGIVPWLGIFVVAVAINVARLIGDYWLIWWSANEFGRTNEFYIGIYAFLGIAQALLTMVLAFIVARTGILGARNLHTNALLSIGRAPMSFFDTNPLGRIVNRFSRDIAECDRWLVMNLRGILNLGAGLLCILGLIAYAVPTVLIVVILVAPAYYYIQQFYRNASRELKRLENLSRSPFFSNCAESFNGLATIRAFRASDQFVTENERLIDSVNRPTILRYFVNVWVSMRAEVFVAVICLAVSTMGVGFGISPFLLGLSIGYTLNLAFSINIMMHLLSEGEGRMNSVERLDHYHKNIPSEAAMDLAPPRPQWPETGSISFNNAEMRYRPDLPPVLKNLTLEVKGGEKIGIVGRTGAGKSSIISALYRLVELSAGSISIDGVDLATVGLRQLRTSLSIIPQAPILFQGTIRSNVDPLNAHDDNAVWTVLEHASLKEYVSSLDEKLDSVVQENGENLSVGQRQLLCLARAMLIKPKILLIDEATASVDIKTDAAIQKALRSSFSECTILCVAHRLLTIIDYDRVLVLKDGEASEYDHPDVLLKNPESIFTDLVNETGPDMSALLKRLAGKRFGDLDIDEAVGATVLA
ncbi:hypothetical protein BDR26DRAFT_929979 [Obelidium mucronatum]|nr:hypothetical protein BDR26DRAFT_929979 [Obelidium mucronatum]